MSESPSRISVRPPATNVCFSRMGSRAGSRLSFNWNHNTEAEKFKHEKHNKSEKI